MIFSIVQFVLQANIRVHFLTYHFTIWFFLDVNILLLCCFAYISRLIISRPYCQNYNICLICLSRFSHKIRLWGSLCTYTTNPAKRRSRDSTMWYRKITVRETIFSFDIVSTFVHINIYFILYIFVKFVIVLFICFIIFYENNSLLLKLFNRNKSRYF